MSPADKSRRIKDVARDLGFCRVGVTPAQPIKRSGYIRSWLDAGRAGTMAYLRRNQAIRTDPHELMEGARSVIVLALNYHQQPPSEKRDDRSRGRVAMYAWGGDYHEVVKDRLRSLVDRMRVAFDDSFEARTCVDTVPILERELAERAGIGWIGKNTMVLHQDVGSYFFLGEIVTTLELAYDEPITNRCGSCTRCLEACPTDAFPAPYEMDASRCISYLTIEHRGDIGEEFHARMGDWVYGCDVCQQVCPFNSEAPLTELFDIRPPGPTPVLEELVDWTQEEYLRILKGSAMTRAKPGMLRRNAAIALANVSSAGSRLRGGATAQQV